MLWYIALGSAIGGVSRYLLSVTAQRLLPTTYPVGTLAVNVAGSFLIGLILQSSLYSSAISPGFRLFLTAGFCGGFTTFSAFSFETATMLDAGQWTRALTYVVASVVLSISAVFLGLASARNAVGLR